MHASKRLAALALGLALGAGAVGVRAAGEPRGLRTIHLDFTPLPHGLEGMPALRVAVAATAERDSVDRYAQDAGDVVEGLSDDEVSRVIGARYTSLGLATRWLADKPPAELVEEALGQELQALGFVVVPAPEGAAAGSPTAAPERAPADVLLSVHVVDFWFDTVPGDANLVQHVKMKADLTASDAATGATLWSGPVDASNLHARPMVMTREHVQKGLRDDFHAFIEAMVRRNDPLVAALHARR